MLFSNYSFNGKEKDDEFAGDGNVYDYGMRMSDSRLGRFMSTDPLFRQYAELSTYQFAGNTPIQAIDLDGGEPLSAIVEKHAKTILAMTDSKVAKVTMGTMLGIGLGYVRITENAIIGHTQMYFPNKVVPGIIKGTVTTLKKMADPKTAGYYALNPLLGPHIEESVKAAKKGDIIGAAAATTQLHAKTVEVAAAAYGGAELLAESSGGIMRTTTIVNETEPKPGISTLSELETGTVDLVGNRSTHILNRHKSGAGKAGKTEFPATWDDDTIINNVNKIANDDNAPVGVGAYDAPYKTGTIDGIEIRVDFYPDALPNGLPHPSAGKVSTAYPTNTTPNPN